jgi:hypothetical protein
VPVPTESVDPKAAERLAVPTALERDRHRAHYERCVGVRDVEAWNALDSCSGGRHFSQHAAHAATADLLDCGSRELEHAVDAAGQPRPGIALAA